MKINKIYKKEIIVVEFELNHFLDTSQYDEVIKKVEEKYPNSKIVHLSEGMDYIKFEVLYEEI